MTTIIKSLLCAFAFCAISITASAQVQTDCTTTGDTTHCTSTDTQQQQQQAYEAGQAIGSGLSALINRGIIAHGIHTRRDAQCRQNGPGSTWEVYARDGSLMASGTCTAQQAKPKHS